MRRFGTRGPVHPEKNYVVSRAEEMTDLINRIKDGRYIVLFAPRQTGKTTFFKRALDALATEDSKYFPIQLDFQIQRNVSPAVFYERLYEMMRAQIERVLRLHGKSSPGALTRFLEKTQVTDSFSMLRFFKQFDNLLNSECSRQHVVLVILTTPKGVCFFASL